MQLKNMTELLNSQQVADYLRITTNTLLQMERRGDLIPIRKSVLGRKIYSKSKLKEFVEGRPLG